MFCQFYKNQNKNNFTLATLTQHVNQQRIKESNVGLIEESMDLSHTLVTVISNRMFFTSRKQTEIQKTVLTVSFNDFYRAQYCTYIII